MWLRAHARKSRLEEELAILDAEMMRTEDALNYELTRWSGRLDSALGPGHRAWAARQGTLWRTLYMHAKDEFATARAKHSCPIAL